MITTLDGSTGNALGFAVQGDVTKSDYDVMTPAVEHAASEYGSAKLLIDLTDFRWEKVDAWGSDLSFGKQLHDNIDKMAIVGDHTWQRYLTKLAKPFYAKDARYFESRDDAWDWIRE
jgi:hypothetical protein